MNVLESFSLKGRVAMVTGAGDPQGYGAQCAIGLWEAGATVYIAARSDDRMKAFCAVLEARGANYTVRRSLGGDVDASCGQLRRRAERERRLQ